MKFRPLFLYTDSALCIYIVVLVIIYSHSTLWLFNWSPEYTIRVCVCVCVCVCMCVCVSMCVVAGRTLPLPLHLGSKHHYGRNFKWEILKLPTEPTLPWQNSKLKAIEHLRRNSVAKISATLRPSLDSRIFPTIPFNSPLWLLKKTGEMWQMTVG